MADEITESERRECLRAIRVAHKASKDALSGYDLPDHAKVLFEDPYGWSVASISQFIANYPSVSEFFRDSVALRIAEVQFMLKDAEALQRYLDTGVLQKPKRGGEPKNPSDYFVDGCPK